MREKACGLDIRKKFLLAAITDQDGPVAELRVSRTQTDLFALKDWVLLHGCDVVACESTSDYWIQIYNLFEDCMVVFQIFCNLSEPCLLA